MRCKLAIYSSLLPLALASLVVACGDRQTTLEPKTKAKVQRPALEADAPVLRWFPPKADMVLVASSLQEFLAAAQQVASLAPAVDLSVLGDRPWDPASWSKRGAVESAPIGLFVSGSSLTAVLPTSKQGTMSRWASELHGDHVVTQTHKGKKVSSLQRGLVHWSWLEVEGYFLLHLNVATGGPSPAGMPWLDAVLEASEGVAYSSTSEAKRAFAYREPGELWGSADPLALLATGVGPANSLACTGLLAQLKGIIFAGSVRSPLASFRSYISLGTDAEAILRSLQTPVVSDGMRAKREGTGVYASIALDPRATSEALRAAQCPELAVLLHNPLASVGWSPPPKAVHLAGTRFTPEKLSGDVALDVTLRSKRFVSNQLGRVPGRSFFEKSMRVQGIRVTRLSIPTMSSLYYHLSNERFVFGTKKTIMQTILAPKGEQERPSAELLAGGLWPERVPQLSAVLRQVIPQRAEREAVAQFLAGVDHATASLHLKGNRLSFEFELQLRAGVTSL